MMIESMESRRLMSVSLFNLPEVNDEVLLFRTAITRSAVPLRLQRPIGSTATTANPLVDNNEEASDVDESAEVGIEESLSGGQPADPSAPTEP